MRPSGTAGDRPVPSAIVRADDRAQATARPSYVPSRPRGVTRRDVDMLAAIDAAIRNGAIQPTMRELGRMLGMRSVSTVMTHVTALCARGYLRRNPYKARTFVVTPEGKTLLRPLAATYGEGNQNHVPV